MTFHRTSLLSISLLLASTAIGFACATDVEDSSDPADRGVGGKADDLDPADCLASSLDGAGVCRQNNGQFAPSACCAEEAACLRAVITDHGQCRDDETGRFIPAACCDAMCEDTKIITGFCRNEKTGQFALSACCADQCFDLQPPDTEGVPAGSCSASCGDQASDGECFCDDICASEGDCCADFAAECPDIADIVLDEGEDNSCDGLCGAASESGNCFCDEICATLGDCCGDKVAHCGGEGDDKIVACESDPCGGTAVDDSGVCRTAGGQFALAACCAAPDRCENADLQIANDGRSLCRDTVNGQFVPMACCDARCESANVDRHGICRNSVNGQFADPACCADQCFVAQTRGDVDAVDACNGTQQSP